MKATSTEASILGFAAIIIPIARVGRVEEIRSELWASSVKRQIARVAICPATKWRTERTRMETSTRHRSLRRWSLACPPSPRVGDTLHSDTKLYVFSILKNIEWTFTNSTQSFILYLKKTIEFYKNILQLYLGEIVSKVWSIYYVSLLCYWFYFCFFYFVNNSLLTLSEILFFY